MIDLSKKMGRIHTIHMIGIGGVGMSGIAEVLLNLGYQVNGSDLKQNSAIHRLQQLGANIKIGHQAEWVMGSDVVVISSAVKEENPELIMARKQRIAVIPRAEMLAELMRFRYGIAVAGTHGKTTTTSLITDILVQAELDPTYVIGGRLNSSGAHARLGDSQYLVAEADESDASFLYLQPMLAVVTNLDMDHMATYQGSFQQLQTTFLEFLHHLPFYGLAVICWEDLNLRKLLPQISKPVLTYGFSKQADIYATNIKQVAQQTQFEVYGRGFDGLVIQLNLPGQHNVLNALASIAIATELEVSPTAIAKGLAKFAGIGRRFQCYSQPNFAAKNVLLIDDYAHHPSEIAATLQAVNAGWRERRLIVVFQPHRYSRTYDLLDDFAQVLARIPLLLVCDVYAAGEAVIDGADGRALCRTIRVRGQTEPIFVPDLQELTAILNRLVKDNDVILMLGAGNIGQIAKQLGVSDGTAG